MPDEEKVDTYNQLDKMVGGLNIQVENYPELKASANYIHLQRTINDLEEKFCASRRTYNAVVSLISEFCGLLMKERIIN